MGGTKVLLGVLVFAATLRAGSQATSSASAFASPQPDHTVEQHRAGLIAFAQGDHETAIREFKKAVHDHPGNSEDWLWLGRSLGRKAENVNPLRAAFVVSEVRKAFEKSVELDPKNLEARADLLDFYLAAPSAFGGGKDKAQAQADAIGRLNKGDGLLALSRIAEEEQKYPLAEQDLKTAAELDPGPGRFRELGGYYRRRKNYPAMEAAFRKSGDAKSFYDLAVGLLEESQKLPEAAELVKKFLAAGTPAAGDEPTIAQARLLLGKIEARQGRRQEAAREFRAALQDNPNFKDAKKELEKVE
jgi:tetratricopeptide (TPR) repeat protein